MTAYTLPPKLTTFERIIFRVPVLGRIWKEVSYGDEGNIYYAIATFISLWGISIMLFGLPLFACTRSGAGNVDHIDPDFARLIPCGTEPLVIRPPRALCLPS